MENQKVVGYENNGHTLIFIIEDLSGKMEKGFQGTENNGELINKIIDFNLENIKKDEILKEFWMEFLEIESEELEEEIKNSDGEYDIIVI